MLPESRMPLAVLTLRSCSDTIRQRRLQPVEIRPPHVEALVGHQAREMLAQSGLTITPAADLTDAARKAVSLAKKG